MTKRVSQLLISAFVMLASCTDPEIGLVGEPTTRPAEESASSAAVQDSAPQVGHSTALARTDHTASGNRLIDASTDFLAATPREVKLPGRPAWVLGAVVEADQSVVWVAVLDDGRAMRIDPSDGITQIGSLAPGEPPELALAGSELTVRSAHATVPPGALPDGRTVVADGAIARYTNPTNTYAHGVLGDSLEGGSMTIFTGDGEDPVVVEFTDTVAEGLSPLATDLDDDGTAELVVTESNADVGARLTVYSPEGTLLAKGPAVGTGSRWRHQIAGGAVGPNGETELIDVLTPHLGGVIEWFRLIGDELVLQASASGYTSHPIGTRNLDLALVAEASGAAPLDVIIPVQDRSALAAVQRDATPAGWSEVGRVELGGRMSTNLAAVRQGDRLALAVGTDQGTMFIWE